MRLDGYNVDWQTLENAMLELNQSKYRSGHRLQKRDKTFFDRKARYLQIAFNYDTDTVRSIVPQIPKDPRILLEAGTPYIKRNGMAGITLMRNLWPGFLVADLKILDGASGEVELAQQAGADAVTIAGSAPPETISLAVKECQKRGMVSMVDMLNVDNPLRVLLKAKATPKIVVLHRGRDEEKSFGKVIQYKQIKRVKSKFNSLISVAGGVDLKEAQSAAFNGANIVVVNLVSQNDDWRGIKTDSEIPKMAQKFLATID